MTIPYYQIDAFSTRIFGGNYAGVCPLKEWLSDEVLQNIAMENNLPETAFFVPERDGFRIRWFTPEMEMDLCGHATLASAYVLKNVLRYRNDSITFYSRSGNLIITFEEQMIFMDFPSRKGRVLEPLKGLSEALGFEIEFLFKSRDYMAVLESEEQVISLQPDFGLLKEMQIGSLIVTAPGNDKDYVFRFFAPGMGILEDPATGSAQCTLVPYWSERLGKSDLTCRQVSSRRGEFLCREEGDRVKIGGSCCLYLTGEISLDRD